MIILLTGGSSFTGYWFARMLHEAGHRVKVTLQRSIEEYQGVRRTRVEQLRDAGIELVERCSFGDPVFLSLLNEGVEILCHHAAHVENYKSLDFNVLEATEKNTTNVRSVLEILERNKSPLVLTGSVFEADEGLGNAPQRPFSPYGLSKGLTWQIFSYWCHHLNVPLHKFVIPNPFGPMEEPRFCSYLMQNWCRGQTPRVGTPDYVRDNIHVSLLAKAYAEFVTNQSKSTLRHKLGPSGYIESQGTFALRFAREMGQRLRIETPLMLGPQTDFSEPMLRINSDPVDIKKISWSEDEAWDELALYYEKSFQFTVKSER